MRRLRKDHPLYQDLITMPCAESGKALSELRGKPGWKNAMPVICCHIIYNCKSRPDIYNAAININEKRDEAVQK